MFRFIRAIMLSYLIIFTAGEKLNFIQIIDTLNNVSSIFALFTGLSVSIMGHSIMQLYSNYIQIRYINKDIDIVSMQSLISKSIKRLISVLPEDVLLSRKFFFQCKTVTVLRISLQLVLQFITKNTYKSK